MLTDRERSRIVRLDRNGEIGELPDGPFLERFDRHALADAIESQATRALLLFDAPKVDLRMDAADALELAKFLRG